MKNLLFSKKYFFFFITLFMFLMTHQSALKACEGHNKIKISKAWARANLAENGNSAIFMKIANNSKKTDKLIKVMADISKTVELHTHKKIGNVYEMRPIPAISLPHGKTVFLKPGGLHIMLIELKQPLSEGETIKATLVFEHSPSQELDIPVLKNGEETKSKDCPCHAHQK